MKKKNKPMKPSRKRLIALSQTVKVRFPTMSVNEGLMALYNEQGLKDLRTKTEWAEDGMKLKKGCKAKWVWGRLRTDTKQKDNSDEEERFKWFPMAMLFDKTDVEPMSDKMAEVIDKKLSRYGKGVRRLKNRKLIVPN